MPTQIPQTTSKKRPRSREKVAAFPPAKARKIIFVGGMPRAGSTLLSGGSSFAKSNFFEGADTDPDQADLDDLTEKRLGLFRPPRDEASDDGADVVD